MPVFIRGETGSRGMRSASASRDRGGDVRGRPRDQPRGQRCCRRLRPVRGPRAPDRGLSRGRHPHRRPRASMSTCTRAAGGSSRTLDVLRAGSRALGPPLHFTETTLAVRAPDAARGRSTSTIHQVADWPTTPEGEAGRPTSVEAHDLDAARAPAGPGDHVVGVPDGSFAGSTAPSGPRASTAPRSPPRNGSNGLIRASGGPPTTIRTDHDWRGLGTSGFPRRLRLLAAGTARAAFDPLTRARPIDLDRPAPGRQGSRQSPRPLTSARRPGVTHGSDDRGLGHGRGARAHG